MGKDKDLELTTKFTKYLIKLDFIGILGIAKILGVHLKKEEEAELIDFPELWAAIIDKFYSIKIYKKKDFLKIIKEAVEESVNK